MATADAALKKMREICLALPDTREGQHFGQTAFYVKKKLFATCGEKRGYCEISFGLEEDHAAMLAETDPKFSLYPRDKRGVLVDVAKVKSWNEIKSLIHLSYELAKPAKATKNAITKAAKKTAKKSAKKARAPKKK